MANIPVELNKIAISETGDAQVIVLRELGGSRVLPIWIGMAEALAIQRKIHGEDPPRPMTHDLFSSVLEKLNIKLAGVVIDRFVSTPTGGTFHAKLQIQHGKETLAVDCRPSDAIALAVRCDASIQIDEKILDEEGQDVSALSQSASQEEEAIEENPGEEKPSDDDEEGEEGGRGEEEQGR